jgi:hypothetical protein
LQVGSRQLHVAARCRLGHRLATASGSWRISALRTLSIASTDPNLVQHRSGLVGSVTTACRPKYVAEGCPSDSMSRTKNLCLAQERHSGAAFLHWFPRFSASD